MSIRLRGTMAGITLGALIALGNAAPTLAASRLAVADMFQDRAVIQRDIPAPIWGNALPNATIAIDFGGEKITATANDEGHWEAELPTLSAGGPYTLNIASAGQRVTLHDILVGDVWLCGGQSNMAFPLSGVTNAQHELAALDMPMIRLLKVEHRSSLSAIKTLPAKTRWTTVSPRTAGDFSAVCQFMGRAWQEQTGVPVGLIDASWGDAVIQEWIAMEDLAALGEYDSLLQAQAAYRQNKSIGLDKFQQALHQWHDTHNPGVRKNWAQRGFDDTGWHALSSDDQHNAETTGSVEPHDGGMWYRTHFSLDATQTSQSAQLHLNSIGYYDIIYVNGKEVGISTDPHKGRIYPIPADILIEGDNVLAISTFHQSPASPFLNAQKHGRIEFDDKQSIPFDQPWRYMDTGGSRSLTNPPRPPWVASHGLSTLYNGMIAAIAPYGMKGFAWYQGESNIDEPARYLRAVEKMVAGWRNQFGLPDGLFVAAQLTSFGPLATSPTQSNWASLREAQRVAASQDPHFGLAVTIDVGDPYDLRPTQKKVIGERMAAAALAILHPDQGFPLSPQPTDAYRQGRRVTVTFNNAATGLQAVSAAGPIGFELCEVDASCQFVEATIDQNLVYLKVPKGIKPAFVRYGWADSPITNLFNGDMMPASPFQLAISNAAHLGDEARQALSFGGLRHQTEFEEEEEEVNPGDASPSSSESSTASD